MNDKNSVLNEFNIIGNAYEKALQNLNSYQFNHPKFTEIQEKYTSEIKQLLDGVINEVNLLNSQIIWDHLVIAFFGETGAGKSTIIETLRLKYSDNKDWQHGSIVGDGQSDYTKESTEYTLNIDGEKVTLIDVPGIEGNEKEYEIIIKEALRKAHIVFYVQGKNRKPDSEIAKKIYDYLSDWTRVYSIYNIRGNIETYELQENLTSVITHQSQKISEEITECFKKLLGNLYMGNISLQALISLAASSKFPENINLSKQHKRVEKLFGTEESAIKFSNFIVLKNQILHCSTNFTEIIKDSSLQKANWLKIKGRQRLNIISNKYNEDIITLKSRINESNRKIKNLINSAKNKIYNEINHSVDKNISSLRANLTFIINNKSDNKEEAFKSQISHFEDSLETTLSSIVSDIFSVTKRQAFSYIKEFEKYRLRNFSNNSIIPIDNLQYNLTDTFSHMKIKSGDVLEVGSSATGMAATGALIGSFIPVLGIGTVAGALIGGGVGIVSSILKKTIFGDKGKAKAIKNMNDQLDVCSSELKMSLETTINQLKSSIDNFGKSMDKYLKNELSYIYKLENDFNFLIKQICY